MSSGSGGAAASLACLPAAAGLPSIDPHAVVAECFLRFQSIVFPFRRLTEASSLFDPFSQVQLTIPAVDRQQTVVAVGVQGVVRALQANRHDLDEALTAEQRAQCTSVAAIAQSLLFPSFTYLLFQDSHVYCAALRPALAQCSMWYERTGQLRRYFLQQSTALAMQFGTARETADRGLAALELLLSRTRPAASTTPAASSGSSSSSSSASRPQYLLGTAYPTSADCYAYAAASSFFYVDASASKDADLLQWLRDCRTKYPLLLHYTEWIRRTYFEDLAGGTYGLKPIPILSGEDTLALTQEATYRSGRTMSLLLTFSFAALYFVVVNADVIVALFLGGVEEEQEEGGEGADEGQSQ